MAQLDISAGLAIALLAFIAVLPEYALDMVRQRRHVPQMMKDGLLTNYAQLTRQG